jgi:beta-1,4-mannooligosaccharide/beta-1,4-mannosyl-N-acetylglucosamine phosphorylase
MLLEGRITVCFAVDTRHGVRGGIAVTDDFYHYEIIHMSVPDNRNMVLFPEKLGGKYVRLERPFPVYGRGGGERFDIWLSDSPDLVYWGNSDLVLGVEDVPYANTKIGPAAPPIKTKKGWLTTFHAVDTDPARGKNGWEPYWRKRYTAGIMLLDLENPYKVIGLCKEPLLAPDAPYESSGGFRNHAVFPCGAILEPGGEVKLYYGAADTVECLATAHVDDLVNLCASENLAKVSSTSQGAFRRPSQGSSSPYFLKRYVLCSAVY